MGPHLPPPQAELALSAAAASRAVSAPANAADATDAGFISLGATAAAAAAPDGREGMGRAELREFAFTGDAQELCVRIGSLGYYISQLAQASGNHTRRYRGALGVMKDSVRHEHARELEVERQKLNAAHQVPCRHCAARSAPVAPAAPVGSP